MVKYLTLSDCARVGLCAKGSERRCVELGLDRRQFFRGEGLPLEEMRKIDDEQIQRAVASADARIAQEESA
jgi:hypothetical protein